MQLRVNYGWDKGIVTTQERQRINTLVDEQLRREFPENVEKSGDLSELDEGG